MTAATVMAALFFAAAPWLATKIGAPHVSGALRVLSLVLLIYGIYTPLVGALNGTRRFVHQAGLDIAAATLRTAGLVVGAYALSRARGSSLAGVEGAAWGFVYLRRRSIVAPVVSHAGFNLAQIAKALALR